MVAGAAQVPLQVVHAQAVDENDDAPRRLGDRRGQGVALQRQQRKLVFHRPLVGPGHPVDPDDADTMRVDVFVAVEPLDRIAAPVIQGIEVVAGEVEPREGGDPGTDQAEEDAERIGFDVAQEQRGEQTRHFGRIESAARTGSTVALQPEPVLEELSRLPAVCLLGALEIVVGTLSHA